MAQLEIFTLGGLRFVLEGERFQDLSTRKVEALAVYLASSGRPQPREVLADLLWDDRSQSRAASNLRVALTNLRKHLGHFITITRDNVALNPDADVWLDVTELAHLLSGEGSGDQQIGHDSINRLEAGLALYKGEFLQGFSIRGARLFEEWATVERERLHHVVMDGFNRVVEWHLAQGDYAAGIDQATRWLQLDPLNEAAYQMMMRLLAYDGQIGAAIRQYEECVRILDEELGLGPSEETIELFQSIQNQSLEPPKVTIALPGGTVTFLFTVIEGSTQLLNLLGDQYVVLLASHRQIIRGALEQWHGREIDAQGDAFFAAFPRATEAVAAVATIQRAMAEHLWPEGVRVRVRMGLHTGEPWLVDEGYVGMDVHRAARIGHVAHGGQILLSETTTALVQDELPEGVTLLDLGRHRLKDMRRPEAIHQLVIEGILSEFPPLRSLEALPAVQPGRPETIPSGAPREVGPSPYRGLAAFRENDAELFFGREAFTAQLAKTVVQRQLVAVIVGPSGSGKSSAVFAGLLPQLREAGDWLIVETRPGGKPFYALAGALMPHLERETSETLNLIETRRLAQALRAGELSLFQITERILARHSEVQRLLLVIDQFEELFTHRSDLEVQRLFLDELLAAADAGARHRRSPLVLLLTLRADFMGQALTHRPFADALQDGSLILGPMNRKELQAAVEKPAELQGAAFETGLVQRILDDVGQEPGNLPLLEFALTLLWERLEKGWMTHAAYDEIGRVDGALARYAEEVWLELDEEERDEARPLFVQLVQPGEGTEDTRRVARRAELAPGRWALVQHLADRRLVVTGRDEAGQETVEVVHEALIRGWERLQSWMMEDRAFRTWQEGLRVAQRGWEDSGRDDGALLRGAPLALALEWADERMGALSLLEKEFIEASEGSARRREAEREAQRQRELEAARKLAEAEKRRAEEQALAAGRLRRRAAFLAGAMVVAALLAVTAFFFARQSNQNEAVAHENADLAATREAEAQTEALQRATAQAQAETERERVDDQRDAALAAEAQSEAEADFRATAEAEAIRERETAEQQANLATSRELALAALNNLETDPELSILLALQALDRNYTKEAEEALRQGIQTSRVVMTLPDQGGEIWGSIYSPDGSSIATVIYSEVTLWDTATGQLLHTMPWDGIDFSGLGLAFNETGDEISLITAGDNYENIFVNIWNVNSGELINSIELRAPLENWSAVLSPDWQLVALGREDGTVDLWDVDSTERVLTLSGHEATVDNGLSFSSDSSRLVTTSRDGQVHVWDVQASLTAGEGQSIASFTTPQQNASPLGAYFFENGSHLALGFSNGDPEVWDLADTSQPKFASLGSGSWDLAIHPEDKYLAVADGSTVFVRDLSTGNELFTLSGQIGVNSLDFSPDGNHLVTGGGDGTARIWDVRPHAGGEFLTFPVVPGVWDLELSPDEKEITLGSELGPATVWDAETGEQLLTLPGESGTAVYRVAYHPDGLRIATVGEDGIVRIWDADTGDLLRHFTGHTEGQSAGLSGTLDVEYSPDGSQLAMAGADGLAKVWDPETGRELMTLTGHTAGLVSLEYSPDGRYIATSSDSVQSSGPDADASVKIWDADTGQELYSLGPNPDRAWGLAFSPDGNLLAISGTGGFISVWDMMTGEKQIDLTGQADTIGVVAFTQDGQRLMTGGAESVSIWDLATGTELVKISSTNGWVISLTQDGRRVYAVDFYAASVGVYAVSLEDVVALAESRLTRSLTSDECRQYLHVAECPARP